MYSRDSWSFVRTGPDSLQAFCIWIDPGFYWHHRMLWRLLLLSRVSGHPENGEQQRSLSHGSNSHTECSPMLHCDRKRIGQTERAGEMQVVICCKISAFTDRYLISLVARKNIISCRKHIITDIDRDTFQIWDVLSCQSNQNFAHFMFFTMF